MIKRALKNVLEYIKRLDKILILRCRQLLRNTASLQYERESVRQCKRKILSNPDSRLSHRNRGNADSCGNRL